MFLTFCGKDTTSRLCFGLLICFFFLTTQLEFGIKRVRSFLLCRCSFSTFVCFMALDWSMVKNANRNQVRSTVDKADANLLLVGCEQKYELERRKARGWAGANGRGGTDETGQQTRWGEAGRRWNEGRPATAER